MGVKGNRKGLGKQRELGVRSLASGVAAMVVRVHRPRGQEIASALLLRSDAPCPTSAWS